MAFHTNHIQKQVLEFAFSNKMQAMEWQRRVPFSLQSELEKKLNGVFEEFEDGTDHYFDTIEIDLGRIGLEAITGKLEDALREELNKQIGNRKTPIFGRSIEKNIELRLGRQERKAQSNYAHLVHFLTHGSMAWNADFASITELEEDLFMNMSLEELVAIMRHDRLLMETSIRKRLYYQLSEARAREIIGSYFIDQVDYLVRLSETVRSQITIKAGKTSSSIYGKPPPISKQGILQWITLMAERPSEYWAEDFFTWYVLRSLSDEIDKLTISSAIRHFNSPLRISSSESTLKAEVIAILTAVETEAKATMSSSDNSSENTDLDKLSIRENEDVQDSGSLTPLIPDSQDSKHPPGPSEDHSASAETHESPKEKVDSSKLASAKAKLEKERVDDNTKVPEEGRMKEGKQEKSINRTSDETKASQLRKSGEGIQAAKENMEKDSLEQSHGSPEGQPIDKGSYELLDDADRAQESLASLKMYYVSYSGLILTWPYLTRLFEHLGLAMEGAFITEEAQERAVLLLGYIASGNSNLEEPFLILSKFLCGWPLQKPIKREIHLQENEKEEIHSMLENLIQNWTILKNTSIQGLRETFFEREGKLQDEEEHWRLIIEQKGTDILLDHLPYSKSMIKLSWMKKMLKIDWA